MKYKPFFSQCDNSCHDLSLRHEYLSIYNTSCFFNHYTALMIDILNGARVATARLTILDDKMFSSSLIIHKEKTKEITTVKEVWICDPNYHKIR